MPGKQLQRAVLLLSLFLFLAPLSACRSTSGSVGVEWGRAAGHPSPPPSHAPDDIYVDRRKGPPAHAPAHGYRAKHRYRYYPDECVYYDMARRAYFYIDNGGWRMAVSLPGSIRLGSSYISLELDTDEPYRYYHEHREKYPPGKMKKKYKKKHKRGWGS